MNTLSIFIYFADTITSLATMANVSLFIMVTILIPSFIAGKLVTWESEYRSNDPMITSKANFSKLSNVLLVLIPICIFISVAVPSKQTIYMIAASELGEQFVNHPETIELYSELKTIILDKIKNTTLPIDRPQ